MSPLPRLCLEHPANAGWLNRLRGDAPAPSFAWPGEVADPYQGCGSHPDVVEWLWDRLGASLGKKARAVICGTPALLDPRTGILLAVALGTIYAVRARGGMVPPGYASTHTYSGGETLDLAAIAGAGWVFGRYEKAEAEWLAG